MVQLINLVTKFNKNTNPSTIKWGFHNLLRSLQEEEYNAVYAFYKSLPETPRLGGISPVKSLVEMEKLIALDSKKVKTLTSEIKFINKLKDRCTDYFMGFDI